MKPLGCIGSTDPRLQRHSALSSLLVDDSPLKAALQPWNHLCIREYDQETWWKNLVVAERKAAEEREALNSVEWSNWGRYTPVTYALHSQWW